MGVWVYIFASTIVVGVTGLLIAFILKRRYAFQNWAGTRQCDPHIFTPTDASQISAYLYQITEPRIRPFGSAHSWSNIVCDDNSNSLTFIDAKQMKGAFAVDITNSTVTVPSGWTIKDINCKIASYNLALPTQAYLTSATIGGAISTSTHGSGNIKTLAAYCQGVEIILADGSKVQMTSADPEFKAVVSSLGTIGFLTSVTLQCVPIFNVSHTRIKTTRSEVFGKLGLIKTENDFYMLFWNPYDDKALLYLWNKTTDLKTSNASIVIKERLLNNKLVGSLMGKFVDIFPNASTGVTNAVFGMLAMKKKHVDVGYKLLPSLAEASSEFRYIEQEIAVDVADIVPVSEAISAFLKGYRQTCCFSIPVGVLFRFVQADDVLLSPAFGRDTVYCSIIVSTAQKGWKEFFSRYERLLVDNFGGRPHLGKYNTLSNADMVTLYGSNLTTFLGVKQSLDSNNRFGNDYTDSLLGI